MDIDKIIQDLNRRFAGPLPEFYKRRIIFWKDPDREFFDVIGDVELDGVKCVTLTGSNTFAVKKRLCEDDTLSNYLVYDPRPSMKADDNWLINVELFSETFRADRNSIWMDEMGLPDKQIIREQVRRYSAFFNAIPRREAVKKLAKNITTAPQMHLAVMAALCGNDDLQQGHILRAVLQAGLSADTNTVYQSFVKYGADPAFWAMSRQGTGYDEGEDSTLGRLAAHLMLTAATRTMHPDHLKGLDKYISIPHQAFCYDVVFDWLHSEDEFSLYEIARQVEYAAKLRQRFEKLAVEDLIDTECFPCVNECILETLMREIGQEIVQVDIISKAVEKRRTMVWYDEVRSYFEGLTQVAHMQAFFLEHTGGFHTVEPQKMWKEYTTDYYRMDTYYRQFHLAFQRSLKRSNSLLDDLFKQVADKVEGLYSVWFLGELGHNWSNVCADELADHGRIFEIPQQTEFYARKIRPNDNRVFVVISDAFRYEVASSLAEKLQRETQCKVTLSSCEAIFPTVTKFGMAALLPHKTLSLKENASGDISVLADDSSTDAPYRDKILKAANANSVALKYDNIIGMKRADRAALVKGMEVVYIYHDKVDEASHTSDTAVFPACDEAIDEIKNLIRIIVNEFGGTNIIVTADHGFLYTYSPLKEDDKVDKSVPTDQVVELDRRYMITRAGAEPEYLLPVKLLGGRTEYEAFAPRENIRIKKKGGGLNFVHGGISLQEMVVPILEYQYLRNSTKAYQQNRDKIDTKPVELSLVSASRKITNMIFSLNFYQKDAVGGNREAATFELYFVDAAGQKISDTCKIIADRTSTESQERTFRCGFNLRSREYNRLDSYYLVIADASGLRAPIQEEFQIDIAFAVDEFNFF